MDIKDFREPSIPVALHPHKYFVIFDCNFCQFGRYVVESHGFPMGLSTFSYTCIYLPYGNLIKCFSSLGFFLFLAHFSIGLFVFYNDL